MTSLVALTLGLFLIAFGALLLTNHRSIDYINRLGKSLGTTHRPSDIEMSRVSVVLGQMAGAVFIIIGFGFVVGELT